MASNTCHLAHCGASQTKHPSSTLSHSRFVFKLGLFTSWARRWPANRENNSNSLAKRWGDGPFGTLPFLPFIGISLLARHRIEVGSAFGARGAGCDSFCFPFLFFCHFGVRRKYAKVGANNTNMWAQNTHIISVRDPIERVYKNDSKCNLNVTLFNGTSFVLFGSSKSKF